MDLQSSKITPYNIILGKLFPALRMSLLLLLTTLLLYHHMRSCFSEILSFLSDVPFFISLPQT